MLASQDSPNERETILVGYPQKPWGVVVKPPIQPGERFSSAVLGQDKNLVDVHHVATTDQGTVFLVESGRSTVEDRKTDIQLIADRIGQLANSPEAVIEMIDQNPFPAPQERW